jgi:phosphatidylinositol 3-kinase
VLELLPTWVDVETEDALELLGSNYSVAPIRRLALRSLEKISDAELLCFLMPLSVALRYDVVATHSQKSN